MNLCEIVAGITAGKESAGGVGACFLSLLQYQAFIVPAKAEEEVVIAAVSGFS